MQHFYSNGAIEFNGSPFCVLFQLSISSSLWIFNHSVTNCKALLGNLPSNILPFSEIITS